jgi:hypothetical protein
MATSLDIFVAALAGTGGVLLMLMIAGGLGYAIFVAKYPWHYAVAGCMSFAGLVGIIMTSIDFSTTDPALRKAVIISQAVIFCFVTILMGFLATYYIGKDFADTNMYTAIVMNASLVISVVALSATSMLKLSGSSQAATDAAAAAAGRSTCSG